MVPPDRIHATPTQWISVGRQVRKREWLMLRCRTPAATATAAAGHCGEHTRDQDTNADRDAVATTAVGRCLFSLFRRLRFFSLGRGCRLGRGLFFRRRGFRDFDFYRRAVYFDLNGLLGEDRVAEKK